MLLNMEQSALCTETKKFNPESDIVNFNEYCIILISLLLTTVTCVLQLIIIVKITTKLCNCWPFRLYYTDTDTESLLLVESDPLWEHIFEKRCDSLVCGSYSEIDWRYYLSSITDHDEMVWALSECAIPISAEAPRDFKGDVYRILSDNTHVGYVRLLTNRNKYLRHGNFSRKDVREHGPAYHIVRNHAETIFRITDIVDCAAERLTATFFDQVFAIRCPYWPEEASEFIKRVRLNGWPSKSLIEEVASQGCHLIQRAHKASSSPEMEWRYSFSRAEQLLIRSWSDNQMYIYHILRLLQRISVNECGGKENTIFRTYHIKTIMLWASESESKDFWKQSNIGNAIRKLVDDIVGCFEKKTLYSFFIRDNNILDKISQSETFQTEKKILQFMTGRPRIDCFLQNVKKVDKHISITEMQISADGWFEKIRSNRECKTSVFPKYIAEKISFLQFAIKYQKLAMCSIDDSKISKHFQFARNYFEKASCPRSMPSFTSKVAISFTDPTSRRSNIVLNETPINIFGACLMHYSLYVLSSLCTLVSCGPSADDCITCACSHLNIGRGFEYNEDPSEDPNNQRIGKSMHDCIQQSSLLLQQLEKISIKTFSCWIYLCLFFFEIKSRKLLLSDVYNANFESTTAGSHARAVNLCDSVINRSKFDQFNTYPFKITTNQMVLFDHQIKELFTFFQLVHSTIYGKHKQLVFAICPTVFAYYIKIRSLLSMQKYHKANRALEDLISHNNNDDCAYHENCLMFYVALINFARNIQCSAKFNGALIMEQLRMKHDRLRRGIPRPKLYYWKGS